MLTLFVTICHFLFCITTPLCRPQPLNQGYLRPLRTMFKAYNFSRGATSRASWGGSHCSTTSTCPEVFCEAKNAPNSFSSRASPLTPLGILRSLDSLTGWSVKYPHYHFIRCHSLFPSENFLLVPMVTDTWERLDRMEWSFGVPEGRFSWFRLF